MKKNQREEMQGEKRKREMQKGGGRCREQREGGWRLKVTLGSGLENILFILVFLF
jgi:hypothetical protein